MNTLRTKTILGAVLLMCAGGMLLALAARETAGAPRQEFYAYVPVAQVPFALEAVPFASGISYPTDIVGTSDGRLFVATKDGRIFIVAPDGSVAQTPLLDIRDQVNDLSFEMGLLGLALHPDFNNNGYIYVYYTGSTGAQVFSQLARFTVGPSGVANPASERLILRFDQPEKIHNGGALHFGPRDGYLYVASGDGGVAFDRDGYAQSGQLLLGKILRIDVDGGSPYAIPTDNPFVGDTAVRDEIWSLGLRNPWRFSFDRLTGDMYIGDVGASRWEEINFQAAAMPGGENYGWPCWEGREQLVVEQCSAGIDYTPPVHVYAHENGLAGSCSVTGGYVYRGDDMPALYGKYLFGDFCSGIVWSLFQDNHGAWRVESWGNLGHSWTTFGEGADGALYAGSYDSDIIFRLTGP